MVLEWLAGRAGDFLSAVGLSRHHLLFVFFIPFLLLLVLLGHADVDGGELNESGGASVGDVCVQSEGGSVN